MSVATLAGIIDCFIVSLGNIMRMIKLQNFRLNRYVSSRREKSRIKRSKRSVPAKIVTLLEILSCSWSQLKAWPQIKL